MAEQLDPREIADLRVLLMSEDGTDEDKGSLGSIKLLTRKENKIRGIVTAQQCKHCGHHEIGITTEEGRFLSLKPGIKVQIVPERF